MEAEKLLKEIFDIFDTQINNDGSVEITEMLDSFQTEQMEKALTKVNQLLST